VGYILRVNLGDLDFSDFQELAPWRALVPVVASEIASLTRDPLLAVQTVLVETYWGELRKGFAEDSLDMFHVVLDADKDALRRRIVADQEERTAESWRLDHIAAYVSARSSLTASADLVIDTAEQTAAGAALQILRAPGTSDGRADGDSI
jgi:hypothetical protein